jgi:hypothetical protein
MQKIYEEILTIKLDFRPYFPTREGASHKEDVVCCKVYKIFERPVATQMRGTVAVLITELTLASQRVPVGLVILTASPYLEATSCLADLTPSHRKCMASFT